MKEHVKMAVEPILYAPCRAEAHADYFTFHSPSRLQEFPPRIEESFAKQAQAMRRENVIENLIFLLDEGNPSLSPELQLTDTVVMLDLG